MSEHPRLWVEEVTPHRRLLSLSTDERIEEGWKVALPQLCRTPDIQPQKDLLSDLHLRLKER